MAVKKTATTSKEYAESIIDTVREPLIILDQDLRVITASRSFYEFFKAKPEETVGQLIYDLGNKQWDIPKLRELLETILPQKTTFDNYEVEHDFTTIGKRTMLLNARQIQRASGKELIILLAIEDVTSRKRAESQREAAEALRESEERYKALFDRSPDLVFIFDFEGRFIDANAAALNRLGYTMKEIRSLKFASFLSKDQLPLAFKTLQEIQDTGIQKKPTEFRLRHKNGSKVHVETTGSTIISKGKLAAILLIARDITVRKVMEEMLALRNVLLSTQQEASIDGILVVDENACILSYNRRFVELWGLPATLVEDGVDEPVLQFVTSRMADPKSFLQRVRYLYEHRQETSRDELILADGRFFDRYSAPMIGSDKRYLGRVWYFRDITERKKMEEELRQSEERYRNIIETIQDGYIEVDLAGNWTFVNDVVTGHLLYSREELTGVHFSKLQTEISAKKSFKAFNGIYKTGKPLKALEMEGLRKDGTIGNYELSISLVKDENGQPTGFRCISRDITERKRAEEALQRSETKFRTLYDSTGDAVMLMDEKGFIDCNKATLAMFGYATREEFCTKHPADLSPPQQPCGTDSTVLANQMIATAMEKGSIRFEWMHKRKDTDAPFSAEVLLNAMELDGKPFVQAVVRDITERKKMEETLQDSKAELEAVLIEMQYINEKAEHLATHDVLTGLPNRLMFSQQLSFAIQTAQRYKRQFAVLFIDLDRFKIINDTLGHEAGDQLLQEIATRLKQSLRVVDVVGRLGGDEFVILIEEASDPKHIAIVAHKILASIIKPITLMGQKFRITASIGICMYPQDAADEQSLMKNADIAMYQAKEEGKNNYQFYSKDIQSKSLEYLSIETNLRFALERNELFLHYQAKVDFKTNMITGVEALLRWQNPYLGSVTPTQFISVAEETGLIIPIGRWVLKTVCAQNVAWQQQGLPDVCMAVNLSLRQLTDDHLMDDIRAALDDSGMAPNLLELEITESMVMHNPELIISILTKIKKMGVRLAIDDFGTGCSSLAQIRHFPIDTLKVDRSFIRNIPQDAEDVAITEAIIAMGKTLSLTVVAEGVGTEEQMKFLKEHACDEMQGYYVSKPVVPEQFADLLRKHVPSAPK